VRIFINSSHLSCSFVIRSDHISIVVNNIIIIAKIHGNAKVTAAAVEVSLPDLLHLLTLVNLNCDVRYIS